MRMHVGHTAMTTPWTPQLETAYIDLCQFLVKTADDPHEGGTRYPELGRRLLEAEQCLTILHEIAVNAHADLVRALEQIAYSAHSDTAPILRGYAQDALAIALVEHQSADQSSAVVSAADGPK
jgi:hypothetical protein